ncbi:hypothetical protein BGX31_000555 [Mortierella sp. GBA43]|nr:hypothetical protein BGX31_000555 [Mortierella sp. GBA43]
MLTDPFYYLLPLFGFSIKSGAATETEDHVTLAEQNSYRNLGIVFDSDHDFEFECRVGALDLSEEFNKYYDQAIAGKYDPNNFQDLLACGGILFMDRGPTPFQHDAFKDEYNTMLNTIHDHIQWASRQDEQDAIDLCRKARSAHREEMRQGTPESARQAIRRVIRGEAESPLTELLDRASRMGKDWKPTSEVDHKSGFILPMLEPLFNRPDATRIAHAATTPSYSPLFIRLCDNFDTKPKTPDIPIRHLEKRDIGVGEVSFEKEFSKDRLDLCRAALLSKRILDQLVTTFSGLDRISIVFFQVVEQKCEFYQMMRCGTVCVASPIGGLTIAYTLDEILKGFEDDCNTWITVCNVFDSLVDSLAAARVRVDSKPGPPVFVGLTTPRSRHMMSDTKRQ